MDWSAQYGLIEALWRIKQRVFYRIGMQKERPRYTPNASEKAIISQHSRHFIETYIAHTRQIRRERNFRRMAISKGYEAFVVGSDQVWRPRYNGFPKAMFLDFTEGLDVKRIAYAVSFGTLEWEFRPELTALVTRTCPLSLLTHISMQ